jgi:LysM repeat protein
VYATRYDSGGAYYVALPDKCPKLTNGGLHTCDDYGYQVGQAYEVIVGYKKSVGARVGETGPWNIDDNYWATLSDPTPRRMFTDLPLGMPEAQAAYFNGYNGGVDQYGRVVTGPYGIDLAREVSIDIGLKPGNNDWVTVSFMWTANWGEPASPGGASAPGTTPIAVQPLQTAAPNADGSVVHEVQYGETLWAIAIAYQVTLDELLALNGLSKEAVILPGDQLLVRPAGEPVQPSATIQPTRRARTSTPTATRRPRRTAAPIASPGPVGELASAPTPDSGANFGDLSLSPVVVLALIGGVIIAGAGLALAGGWLNSRKP